MKTKFLVVANVLLCALWCSFSITYGQQASRYVPNLIPASPEAASLGKFVEVPVNLYQGLPQITIPIHEFKVGSISIPVALKYHASGFRVSETASSVGAGWTLEAGGTLSRTLRGLDDEHTYGYLNSNDARWFFNSVGYPKLDQTLNPNSTSYNGVTLAQVNATGLCDLIDKQQKGERDTEPDLYTFSAPGLSGKFVYNLDGKVHFIPHQNTTIYSNVGPTQVKNSFTLTSAQGIEYYFGTSSPSGYLTGHVERNSSTGYSYLFETPPMPPNPEYIYNSAWHLSRISSKNSLEDVQYEYEPQTTETISLTNQSFATAITNGGMLAQNNMLKKEETKTKTTTAGGRLKRMTGPEGIEILFMYDATERKDLVGGHRLKTIEVKKYGVLIKKYELTHSYFGNIASYDACYLKLDKVEQKDAQGNALPPYLLTYHQDIFGNYFPTSIGRNSYTQDEWGFYNARNTNSVDFFPTTKIYPSGTYPNGIYVKAADRSINESVNHCGMLTKIQYPTGGFHEITYEQNEYRLPTNQTHYEQIKLTGLASTAINDGNLTIQNGVTTYRLPFTITSQTGNKWLYIETEGYNNNGQGGVSSDCYTAIENSSGQLTYNPIGFVSLAPGNYFLVARKTSSCSGEEPTIKIEYENDGVQIYSKKTGGVRIKTIRTHDGISTSNDIYKVYEYIDNQGRSTGRLNMLPTYHYVSSFTDNTGSTGTMLNVSAFTPSVANHIGYAEVRESFGKKQNSVILPNALGQKVYTYTHEGAEPVPLLALPKTESQIATHYNGRLLSETTYDKQGRKLTEKINSYNYETLQSVYGMRFAVVASRADACPTGTPLQTYNFVALEEKSDWSEILQSIERNYSFTTGATTASTYQEIITDYVYGNQVVNNQKTYYLREKTSQNSEGKTTKTKYKYPFDFTGTEFSNIEPRYTTPIETIELKDDKIVGGTLTKFINTAGYTTPKEIYALDIEAPINNNTTNFSTYGAIPSPYKLKAIFGYDEFLRIVNLRDEQEQEQSFIRVNQGSDRMIANIAGASLDKIAYMGMETEKESFHFTVPSGNQMQGGAFSGDYYVKAGAVVTSATMPIGRYILSFYTKGQGNVNINIGSQSVSSTSTSTWQYQQIQVDLASAGTVILSPGASVALDEIRLHPVGAQMTTRTYHPWGGIRDLIDVKGQKQTYEYDNFYRLKAIRDLDGNIIKTWNYHYKY